MQYKHDNARFPDGFTRCPYCSGSIDWVGCVQCFAGAYIPGVTVKEAYLRARDVVLNNPIRITPVLRVLPVADLSSSLYIAFSGSRGFTIVDFDGDVNALAQNMQHSPALFFFQGERVSLPVWAVRFLQRVELERKQKDTRLKDEIKKRRLAVRQEREDLFRRIIAVVKEK